MAEWECNMCGRKIQSDVEPAHCPCGSEEIEGKEEKSRLEEFIGRLF
jgi:ABC-type ATPase with predicted acetyltransferase domain